jgi:hypothetical protein
MIYAAIFGITLHVPLLIDKLGAHNVCSENCYNI